jgi:hypothetical protein
VGAARGYGRHAAFKSCYLDRGGSIGQDLAVAKLTDFVTSPALRSATYHCTGMRLTG